MKIKGEWSLLFWAEWSGNVSLKRWSLEQRLDWKKGSEPSGYLMKNDFMEDIAKAVAMRQHTKCLSGLSPAGKVSVTQGAGRRCVELKAK